MFQVFLIPLREALQCAAIAALVLSYPGLKDNATALRGFIIGVLASFAAGFLLGYASYGKDALWDNGTWTSVRYILEAAVFYLGMVLLIVRPPARLFIIIPAMAISGFFLFFFESRAAGFLIHGIGIAEGGTSAALLLAIAGTAIGLGTLYPAQRLLKKIPLHSVMTLPGLLIFAGALKLSMGGVAGLEEGSIMISLQRGIMSFLVAAVPKMQSTLMISGHPFMDAPFAGLASFIQGDRAAMTLMVLFFMTPPVFMLIRLFAEADPVGGHGTGAEKRLKITFFRKEIFLKAIPGLAAFSVLIISIHAANIALNPLYEPAPMPVKAAEGSDYIEMPLSDKLGDLTDGKLRKYVYYYGEKQILFLAILKPDGSVGVALDECEICRPAEWNKSAQGYAQGGGNLICKYCMTPIAIQTVNEPGGCNPIPLRFGIRDRHIIITLEDLIRTYKSAQALEKKGMHL
ncbi:MAG: Fe-S-containing protein [Thermodesulfovibrionales bacterium]|nr:Fe-S-containing protein [Thermodesulfovibrionales bacterium]